MEQLPSADRRKPGTDRANLIVGDVKQSIYRFRNSDWKLLDEQVQADFSQEEVREETFEGKLAQLPEYR